MIRTCTVLLTMAGAITLAPAVSHDSAAVRAKDWDDYWDEYEDAREDYYEDLRDRERRYWRRHRRYYRLPHRVYGSPVIHYPGPVCYRSYGVPYDYYRPGVSVRVGRFGFHYWR